MSSAHFHLHFNKLKLGKWFPHRSKKLKLILSSASEDGKEIYFFE